MSQGWICLHRSILDWEWYEDKNATRLFIHCLLRANHKDKEWRGKDIKRGQFWTSLETLTAETGLTQKQIRGAISKLEGTGEMASKGYATGRMITMLNYESYQGEGKQKGEQKGKQGANEGQAEGKQRATNNNDNNENNENNVNNNSKDYGHFPENEEQDNSDLLNSMLDYHEMNDNFTLQQQDNLDGLVSDETAIKESFDRFWDAYAKKKKPKDCLAKWKSKKLYLIADEIMADIENRKEHCNDWRLTGPKARQWQPHPLTYLNSDGWKSELSPKPVEQAMKKSQFESKEQRIDRINEENRAKLFGPRKTNQAIEQDFIEGELQHEPRER